MKVLKIIIPVAFLLSILALDYFNKFYKDNTAFENESIYLYVIKDDSIDESKLRKSMGWIKNILSEATSGVVSAGLIELIKGCM